MFIGRNPLEPVVRAAQPLRKDLLRIGVIVFPSWSFSSFRRPLGAPLLNQGCTLDRFQETTNDVHRNSNRHPFGRSHHIAALRNLVSYTSLGLGDVWPTGVLRLITGLEALNGLILIAWSASFTYLSMEKFWEDHPVRRSS